ncbi:hypothetical protein MycrhDRAFT_1200 [Mycolicibacterium rhodesiae JS60]|nr:hypothetical protein MycrhDRAFT_1200 [Mycolicibacterium rhodesiae JS60]
MGVATGSGTVVYDDFTSTAIDGDRWRYLTLPAADNPEGVAWTCFEPAADTQVGEGTLDMYVPQFSPRHQSIQVYDNLKHQLVSQQAFATDVGVVRFVLDMAATRAGDAPTDFRDGFASFMVIDIESGWSFRVCSTGHRTFGLYDSLRVAYQAKKSAAVLDSPVSAPAVVGGSLRHEIVIDRSGGTLQWSVDGRLAARIDDPAIPASVHIALGLATLNSVAPAPENLPRSAPPGLSVSFGPVSIQAAIADAPRCGDMKSA